MRDMRLWDPAMERAEGAGDSLGFHCRSDDWVDRLAGALSAGSVRGWMGSVQSGAGGGFGSIG
jgi:hypothetical protein